MISRMSVRFSNTLVISDPVGVELVSVFFWIFSVKAWHCWRRLEEHFVAQWRMDGRSYVSMKPK
jgi:hypothetical protein